ncbi:MAG: hypothetical protein FJ144_04495 [Deltaproteobacteria bacterium]|nr:hypothetical protein [Deltaproteobacteria bacterium]
MTTETKTRWVKGFLWALVAWPFVHFAITRSLDIDPWRLGGWAMYATTPIRVELNLTRITPQGEGPVERMSQPMIEWGDWYINNGARLGPLYPPDGGAAIVFANNPGVNRIAIYVSHGHLTWRGDWGYATTRYEYIRPGTRIRTTPLEGDLIQRPTEPPGGSS